MREFEGTVTAVIITGHNGHRVELSFDRPHTIWAAYGAAERALRSGSFALPALEIAKIEAVEP